MFKVVTLITLILIIGCASQKEGTAIKEGKIIVNATPPNGIRINDTLFCDKTELCNIDYKEYQDWTLYIYGRNSQNYRSTLLDSTIVLNFMETHKSDTLFKGALENADNYLNYPWVYFTHPSYGNYPVIGITYQQAVDYSKWRSDRVYEMMLIKKNIIKLHLEQNASNCFTIERYLAGQYFNYIPTKKVPIARFRLPSIEEWELIARKNGGDEWGINNESKDVKKYLKNNASFFLTKDYLNKNSQEFQSSEYSKKILPYTAPVKSFFYDKNYICNLIGNVAEMTNTEGVAKGGSWYHTNEQSKIKNNISYNKEQVWLGVRNVCTWEIPK